MPYNPKILEYAKKREMYGELPDDQETGVGYVGNAACGDMLKVYIKVNKDNIIEDVKVKTYGCGCAIASTALAAEKLKGKSIDEALKLKDKDLADELDLPGIKKHCSVLAEAAVKNAVKNYKDKQESGEWQELEVSMFDDVSKGRELAKGSCSDKTVNKCCSGVNGEQAKTGGKSCCNKTSDASLGVSKCCNKTEEQSGRSSTSCTSESKSCTSSHDAKSSGPKTRPTAFQITQAARDRFLQILEQYQGNIGVLIASEAGGCAGNSYMLDVVSEQPENTQLYEFDTLKIFVAKTALMYVLGVTIDYVETDTEAGFKFTHPSLKMCGCGESFR